MMRKLFYTFLLISSFAFSQKKTNILFIGNSLTYYHDMPKMLQEMFNESRHNYNVEQSTYPGFTLESHLNSIIIKYEDGNIETRTKEKNEITETEKKIASKKWDIVILQESPGNQIFPEVIQEITNPAINKIQQLVNNDKCQFYVFNTWISINFKYPQDKFCVPKHYFSWEKYYQNEEISNAIKFCSLEITDSKTNLKILNESYNSISNKKEYK